MSRPTLMQRLRVVNRKPGRVLVNDGETRSVVGSDNHAIASAMSLLIGTEFRDQSSHPGRLTPGQARDVIAWAGR